MKEKEPYRVLFQGILTVRRIMKCYFKSLLGKDFEKLNMYLFYINVRCSKLIMFILTITNIQLR